MALAGVPTVSHTISRSVGVIVVAPGTLFEFGIPYVDLCLVVIFIG